MQEIMALLPPKDEGHSLLELSGALETLGIRSAGTRLTFEELSKRPFPIIMHLKDPDHYVTVWNIRETRVYVFDGSGRNAIVPSDAFSRRWTGVALELEKTPVKQDVHEGPYVEFERLILDMGDVPWTGKTLEYRFPFLNTGAEPLVINSVKTDCGCVGSEYEDDPVPPGGSGTVVLKYQVTAGQGAFLHKAAVVTNCKDIPIITLEAAGTTDTTVGVVPSVCNFGGIVPGQTRSRLLFVRYNGDTPLRISGVTCTDPRVHVCQGSLSLGVAKAMWPGAKDGRGCVLERDNTEVVQLAVETGRGEVPGAFVGSIEIKTNISGYESITIPCRGWIMPEVRLFPSIAYLDERNRRVTVDAISADGSPARIMNAATSDQTVSVKIVDGPFGHGQRLVIEAEPAASDIQEGVIDVSLRPKGSETEKIALELPYFVSGTQ
jgi:hypothetical protein